MNDNLFIFLDSNVINFILGLNIASYNYYFIVLPFFVNQSINDNVIAFTFPLYQAVL